MSTFFVALVYVFLAELGDKTQLMTLAFTTRYRTGTVLSAITLATALLNLVSVGLGAALGKLLPLAFVGLVAGISLIVFGFLELKNEDADLEGSTDKRGMSPFWAVFSAFLVAELGDKTMLATFAVAAQEHNFWLVWAGSTVGLVTCNALGILAGHFLKNKFSARELKYGIATIYFISGIVVLNDSLQQFVRLTQAAR